VVIVSADVSARLREWISLSNRQDDQSNDDAPSFPYYRVKTRQGTFGLFFAASPALDLCGTGVTFEDVESDISRDAPDNIPPIMGLTGELDQIIRLRVLMEKKYLMEA
jgi:hypothetical protein